MSIKSALLRAITVERTVSIQHIGLLINQSERQVWKLAHGECAISIAEVVVIAHALGIDWREHLSRASNGATD